MYAPDRHRDTLPRQRAMLREMPGPPAGKILFRMACGIEIVFVLFS
jgi:hypothetical protein